MHTLTLDIQHITPHVRTAGYLIQGVVADEPTPRTVYLPMTLALTLGPIVRGERWHFSLDSGTVTRAQYLGGDA